VLSARQSPLQLDGDYRTSLRCVRDDMLSYGNSLYFFYYVQYLKNHYRRISCSLGLCARLLSQDAHKGLAYIEIPYIVV
jgi:hypothetical protein